MKFRSYLIATMLAAVAVGSAQQRAPLASSHAPTVKTPVASAPAPTPAKPAVRVNGAVLTETDVVREMYSIFPYAKQHNGFPKDMEPEIRKGATDMVIFEELLYQEAKRRNLDIPAERITKAYNAVRAQFPDKKSFDLYLRADCNNSTAILKEKIRRSMLIEKMLKSEVEQKAVVTPAAVKAFYDKNPKAFEYNESFQFQTISIIPPDNASAAIKDEGKRKIIDAARLAKLTKDYRSFGVLAEQISEDDWHTKLGDRGMMEAQALPPAIVDALRKMKVGEVNGPLSLGTAWVVLRLEKHQPAGKATFAESKTKLMSDMQKQKRMEIRAELNKKLRKDAKIEVL